MPQAPRVWVPIVPSPAPVLYSSVHMAAQSTPLVPMLVTTPGAQECGHCSGYLGWCAFESGKKDWPLSYPPLL